MKGAFLATALLVSMLSPFEGRPSNLMPVNSGSTDDQSHVTRTGGGAARLETPNFEDEGKDVAQVKMYYPFHLQYLLEDQERSAREQLNLDISDVASAEHSRDQHDKGREAALMSRKLQSCTYDAYYTYCTSCTFIGTTVCAYYRCTNTVYPVCECYDLGSSTRQCNSCFYCSNNIIAFDCTNIVGSGYCGSFNCYGRCTDPSASPAPPPSTPTPRPSPRPTPRPTTPRPTPRPTLRPRECPALSFPGDGDLCLFDVFAGSYFIEGRLEVYHDGEWGTVCDDLFTEVSASVACRQLGYSGVDSIIFDASGGEGLIWMDNVECSGSESRLIQCPFNGFGNEDCSHSEDVGISCLLVDPTPRPTPPPTNPPTPRPTPFPTTTRPTPSPTTPLPTSGPPTPVPTTSRPTPSPTTPLPTSGPPTPVPITSRPTPSPTTLRPTDSPEVPPTVPTSKATSNPTESLLPTLSAEEAVPPSPQGTCLSDWNCYCESNTLSGELCLPGVGDMLGYGINLVNGEKTIPLTPLRFGSTVNLFTHTGLGRRFEIPENVVCEEVTNFSETRLGFLFDSSQSYRREIAFSKYGAISYRGAYLTGSVTYKRVKERVFERSLFLAEIDVVRSLYSCRLKLDDLTPTGEAASILSTTDLSRDERMRLIGTHIIRKADFGGRLRAQAYTEVCALASLTSDTILGDLSLIYKPVAVGRGATAKVEGRCGLLQSLSTYSREVIGGDAGLLEVDGNSDLRFDNWRESIASFPEMINITVSEMELFDSDHAIDVKEYFDSFPGEAEIEVSGEEPCAGFDVDFSCREIFGGSGKKCLPLKSMVLIEVDSGYAFEQISNLNCNHTVVVGDDDNHLTRLKASSVVDFAHRDDAELTMFLIVEYVDTNTEQPKSIAGSVDHNVVYGIYNRKKKVIEEQRRTFGILRRRFEAQRNCNDCGVFIRNGRGQWLSVIRVSSTLSKGFLAPVTDAGKLLIFPRQVTDEYFEHNLSTMLNKSEAKELLQSGIEVSCFSTLPDEIVSIAYFWKRIVWGPEKNEHGAGAGLWFDSVASVSRMVGQMFGHIAQ